MTEKKKKSTLDFATLRKKNSILWMKLWLYTCSYEFHTRLPPTAAPNVEMVLVNTSTQFAMEQYS